MVIPIWEKWHLAHGLKGRDKAATAKTEARRDRSICRDLETEARQSDAEARPRSRQDEPRHPKTNKGNDHYYEAALRRDRCLEIYISASGSSELCTRRAV